MYRWSVRWQAGTVTQPPSPEPNPADPADESPDEPLTGGSLSRRRIGLVLGTVAVLIIGFMWVAAFSGWGSTETIDQLKDKRWTAAARSVCAPRQADFDKVPDASTAKTPQDRAGIVEDSIGIFTTMTDELAALEPPSNPTEAKMVTDWLGDWDRHLEDRRRFATTLETGQKDAQFTESLREKKQISRYIDRFARVNDMEDCGTPEDL